MSGKNYDEILVGAEAACELVQPLFDLRALLEEAVGLDGRIAALKAEEDRMIDQNNNLEANFLKRESELKRAQEVEETRTSRAVNELKAKVAQVQAQTEKQIKMYREEEAMWKKKKDDADLDHSNWLKSIRNERAKEEGLLSEVQGKLAEARKLVGTGG